jgi:hypothetical protein
MSNRDVKAAVAVFSSQAKTPISTPIRRSGPRIIVVLDKVDPDPQPLRLALLEARLIAQRHTAGSGSNVDLNELLGLADGALRVLDGHTTIRRSHAGAKRWISKAEGPTALPSG